MLGPNPCKNLQILKTYIIQTKYTYKVGGELFVVIPGSDDDALSGVGGKSGQHNGTTLPCGVVDLTRKCMTLQHYNLTRFRIKQPCGYGFLLFFVRFHFSIS